MAANVWRTATFVDDVQSEKSSFDPYKHWAIFSAKNFYQETISYYVPKPGVWYFWQKEREQKMLTDTENTMKLWEEPPITKEAINAFFSPEIAQSTKEKGAAE